MLLPAIAAGLAVGVTKFITIGDWGAQGLGSYQAVTQKKVAGEMATCASDNEISFVVNTGDNFYYCGIQGTDDKQVAEDFTNIYTDKALDVPWYSVLGNHEYGYNVDAQIELSKSLPRWVMDDRYYTRRVTLDSAGSHHATFIFLDSSPCYSGYRGSDESLWDPCGSDFPTCDPIKEGPCKFHENILGQNCLEQFDWFQKQLKQVPADDWLIIVGHAPADELDVADFAGAMLDTGLDLYLNGHVHTLSQYSIDGNPAFVTSGAGAMLHTADQHLDNRTLTKLAGGDWPIANASATAPIEQAAPSHVVKSLFNQKVAGFTLHTFSADYAELTTEYVTFEGTTVHSFTVKKGARRGRGAIEV